MDKIHSESEVNISRRPTMVGFHLKTHNMLIVTTSDMPMHRPSEP